MAPGRKQRIKGIALAASYLAFVLLLVQEDLLLTFFVGVIAAVFLAFSLRNAPPKESPAQELPYWLVAAAVNCYEAAQFYRCWRDSAKLRGIADSLHISYGILLPACCIALAAAALPFFVAALRWLWRGPETERLRRVNRWLSSPAFHRICLLLALAFMAIQVYYAFSCDIWYDECVSMTSIAGSYWDMILMTAKDCHPPLYYIILKTVVDAARFALPAVDELSVAKMVSIVPYAILLMLCATKVRRRRGNFVAGLWAVCIVAMPNLMQYGVEVRMYSWGLLFVTLAYLWTDEVVHRGRASDWTLFVCFSLCAAYTHYFALVAATFCYLSLLIWYWANERAGLKRWFLASAITVVGYLPWLFVFLGQASRVSKDFWIPEVTLNKLKQFVGFVYGNIGLVLLSAFFGCALLYRILRRRAGRWEDVFAFTGLEIALGVVAVGVIVSLLMQPVFVNRYAIPAMACTWIGMLMFADGAHRWKRARAFVALCLIVSCASNAAIFAQTESAKWEASGRTKQFFAQNEDAVYIGDYFHVWRTVAYLSGDDTYYWKGWNQREYDEERKKVVKYCTTEEEALELLKSSENVYFVDQPENDLTLADFTQNLGYEGVYEGRYWLEETADYYRLVPRDE